MTDVDQAQTEWLAWRRGGIGASDIAAAYSGIYGGAYKAVASRIGITVDEIDPALAARGHRWEQAIADGVHAHTGLYVGGEQIWLEHPTRKRYRCTPDGLLMATPEASIDDVLAGLEVKTKGPSAPWAWLYWTTQCQWSMIVAQLPKWLLVIATIDSEFDQTTGALTPEQVASVHYKWIYADHMLQPILVDLANELLDYVDRGELPPPTDPEALPYVKAANATADPYGTANIDDLADLISRYQALKEAEKSAADERATAEAVLRARMGEATEATTTDGAWRVRCGHPIRKFISRSEDDFIDLYGADHPELLRPTLDRSAAKKAMADEYDALRFPTPDRRLTIKHMEH